MYVVASCGLFGNVLFFFFNIVLRHIFGQWSILVIVNADERLKENMASISFVDGEISIDKYILRKKKTTGNSLKVFEKQN